MKKILVAPSILSADFRSLEREVKAAEDAGADMIHCDVMDGHFVPNLTFGPFVVEAVKKCVSIPLDVHLMISNPGKYIGNFCDAGADILSFHAEAVAEEAERRTLLESIRARGVRSGIAVNPDIPVDLFIGVLDAVDMAVIMSVYAGFGGQKFIPDVLEKVRAIRQAADKRGPDIDIQVDGGVNGETAALCAAAGANVLVAGSYVFCSDNYADRISAVRGGGQ
ncbi:MAG: ribulose-phosphate 3-epimerase [Chitinispirillales bacterium]|jgi:ribulose-phosphate 3-epimerase|nr:ribulose-phosphate 3-epimerase [Chitinispirillales bacterium]